MFLRFYMKAVYLEKKGTYRSLVTGEIPQPWPQAGQVMVKIHATTVMPSEFDWKPTFNTPQGQSRPFPIVLSHEFSGTVEVAGVEVTAFRPGDEVYGVNDWYTDGAQAEYCIAATSGIALKPKSLDHVKAAVTPISALTAWQGLFDKAKLVSGQSVLIHGASGGVGSFAVQMAHRCGAWVVATASSANLTFVRGLGADEVIDYRRARFEDVVKAVDVVFDTVGGDTLEQSWRVLRSNGRMVTIVSQDPKKTSERSRKAFMLVRADGEQLAQIGRLIDAGELKVCVGEVFPLEKAADAYARAEQGGLRGKVALRLIE